MMWYRDSMLSESDKDIVSIADEILLFLNRSPGLYSLHGKIGFLEYMRYNRKDWYNAYLLHAGVREMVNAWFFSKLEAKLCDLLENVSMDLIT